jgi:putative PEP-CTERM system TPR-repeat lipoprotein
MSLVLVRPVLVSLALAGLVCLASCDTFVSAESRMERAAQLRGQGDYRAAGIELKKLLQKHPDHREARFLLGETSLLIGEAAAAEKELRRAQDLGVPRERVVVPLGQAIVNQGHFDRVLQELDSAAVSDDEVKTGILMHRSAAYLALGRLDDAERAFREALALRPDSLDARLGLAAVEQGRRNLGAAEAHIADVLARDPTFTRAWLAKGRIELVRNRYAQAEEAFARALDLPSPPVADEFIARNGLAESQWRQGKMDAALQNVERLMMLAPDQPGPRYLRALIAYSAGDYGTARNHLQQVLRAFPDYRPAALLLGATHYAQGELEQADMYLSSALAADPSSVSARKLLAATRLRQKKPQEAIAALSPAMPQASTDRELLALMGRASLEIGDAGAGIEYLERSAGTDPSNLALQVQLAVGYMASGDAEHAIKLLEKLPRTESGAYGRELLLILAYMRSGDHDSAVVHADKIVGERPNDPGAYNLAGNAYMAAGRLPLARQRLEKALQLRPDDLTVLMNLGRLEFREGKQDAARARFERVLALSPNHVNAMMALAQLSALRDDRAGVRHWLERAAAADPTAIDLKLLLIQHHLTGGDRAQARSVATQLAKAHPAQAEVQNVLGIVQMADGSKEEAVASFRSAVAAAPRSAAYTYNLARAELSRGRDGEARKLLTKTLEMEPDHLRAIFALSALEVRQGNAQQAFARARGLQQNKKTAADGYALEGDLHMMQRRFDHAARAYDASLKHVESAQLAIKAYRARRQAQLPDPLGPLERWLGTHPGDVGVCLALAEGYQVSGQFKRAAAHYELVLERHADNAIALNNLAWVYQQEQDPRAIEVAERAYRAQPDSGAIADTLGWLLVQDGQTRRGVALLREAVRLSRDTPDIRYHLAVALAGSGAKDEARTILAELVSSGQTFGDLGKAKQMLQDLR